MLSEHLLEDGNRPVTVLGSEVGWDAKVLASREVSKNGGAVLLDCIDSEEEHSAELREAMQGYGEMLHIDIAPESAEYDMAADIAVDSDSSSPGETARIALQRLRELGLLMS